MENKVNIENNISLDCNIAYFAKVNFKIESGYIFRDLKIAYKNYGVISKKKDNVILVCHALTGDQYIAGKNPITNKDGWWDRMVGPNKPIDTNKYFVICSNVIGGCLGSTGPKEINSETNLPY